MATGLFWHEHFARYDTGEIGTLMTPHPLFEPLPTIDNPLPKKRLRTLLDTSGLAAHLDLPAPRQATELEPVHSPDYLGRLAALSVANGDDGDGAHFGPGDYEIAKPPRAPVLPR